MHILPLILCGGRGTRLAPLFPGKPKQFQSIFNSYSLLQNTLLRLDNSPNNPAKTPLFSTPLLLSNVEYRAELHEQMAALNWDKFQLLLEPVSKNTGPAIVTSIAYLLTQYAPDSRIIILPSDHFIDDSQNFRNFISKIDDLYDKSHFKDRILLFGVEPYCDNSHYGHMLLQDSPIAGINKLIKFAEKPNAKEINQLKQKKYKMLWNSGIFFGSLQAFQRIILAGLSSSKFAFEYLRSHKFFQQMSSFKALPTQFSDKFKNNLCFTQDAWLNKLFSALPAFPFDNFVITHPEHALVAPINDDFHWYDLGNETSIVAFQRSYSNVTGYNKIAATA